MLKKCLNNSNAELTPTKLVSVFFIKKILLYIECASILKEIFHSTKKEENFSSKQHIFLVCQYIMRINKFRLNVSVKGESHQ
ncbi:hypothetical protein AM232_08145 [Bacillus sp. FJAT-21352]|nr:hypothetical protein AM232_08145 [Bacillus sp. FJAT-21352]